MNTEYVICTDCMSGGTVEKEKATLAGGNLTMVDYTCSECGADGREWITDLDTEWSGRSTATVRRVDLSAPEWAEARGTW